MIKYCLHCGRSSESDIEMKYCPHCGTLFEDKEAIPENKENPAEPIIPQAVPDQPIKYVSWEDRGKEGFFGSLFETWKQSTLYPVEFFRKMPVTGGIWNPLFYGLIFYFISMVFSMIYMRLFSDFFDFSRFFPYLQRPLDYEFQAFNSRIQSISNLITLVAFPIIGTVGFLIIAGILHFILFIFGWKKENFEATFRIITYSNGPEVFSIIPFLGWIIAPIWRLVLVILGIREVHKITTGKAVLVVFLPMIVFCLCCCGTMIWLISLIGLAR